MKKRITIEINEALSEDMERFKPFLNFPAIATTAFKNAITDAKEIEAELLMRNKVKEGEK